MTGYVFLDGLLADFLGQRRQSLQREIVQFPRDDLLNASEADMCSYLTDRYTLHAPTIHLDKRMIVEARPIEVPQSTLRNSGTPHRQGPVVIIAVHLTGMPSFSVIDHRPARRTRCKDVSRAAKSIHSHG
jgi:hypothetical protein